MVISPEFKERKEDLIDLFSATFTASAGANEGAQIGAFVRNLLEQTADEDLFVFVEVEAERIVGAIAFSRLTFEEDDRSVFILSPVAVATDFQRRGIGQALIRHGLEALRSVGVDVALTYGDPAYYGRFGFKPLSEETARPPLPLSQPEGWLGQSLSDTALTPIKGASRCVAALNNPALW